MPWHNYALCDLIGALKFESGSIQSDKNVAQNTRPSFTHMWRFGNETNVLRCSWSLHLNCVHNLHLRHSCMFAYSQTGRTSSLSLLCSSLSQTLSAPSFHDNFLIWGTVCVKLLHRQTCISLMLVSIQLLIHVCCLQFLLSKQQTTNNGYMTTCPELGCKPNSGHDFTA